MSSTRHYDVDGGPRIPLEAHRVAQQFLRLGVRVAEVPTLESALAAQCVDVVGQSQQSPAPILHLQLQEVAAALRAVHTFLHVDHAHQREPAESESSQRRHWQSLVFDEVFSIQCTDQ